VALVAVVGPCCNASGPNGIDPDLRQPSTDEGVVGIETRFGGWSLRITGVKRRERDLIGSVDVGAPDSAYELRYVVDLGEPFRTPPELRPLPVYDRRPSSFGLDRYLLTNPRIRSEVRRLRGHDRRLDRRSPAHTVRRQRRTRDG
jgi:hypothetical protein